MADEPEDPYDWYVRGHELQRRGWRPAEAERAYRRAIDGGYTDAWLYVGALISGRRGRRSEEAAAYRAAASSDDPEVASWAALRLANMLDRLDGDLPAAQGYFEQARDQGSGATHHYARMNLGFLLAYLGEREAAEVELRSFVTERCAPDDDEMSAFCARLAATWTAAASGGWTRRGLRSWRVASYRVGRACRPLRTALPGGPR